MKTYNETNLINFNAWSGAKDTKELILSNNKEDEFDSLIKELYPDGISETKLNDILWFEEDWICEMLGIDNEEDIDDEDYDTPQITGIPNGNTMSDTDDDD